MPTIELLEGNPDGGIFATEFDRQIWDASKKMAPILHHHVSVIKNRRIPSKYWLSSLIQAFASVAYKHKRLYKRSDFLSWWKPSIMAENSMLDNISKIHYPNKFDRGIGGLRELREQGKVPDIIWKPWTITSYSHTPTTPLSILKSSTKTIVFVAAFGIAAYFLTAPIIIKHALKR